MGHWGTFPENIRPNHNFIIGYRHICFSMRCTQMERKLSITSTQQVKRREFTFCLKNNNMNFTYRYQYHLIFIKKSINIMALRRLKNSKLPIFLIWKNYDSKLRVYWPYPYRSIPSTLACHPPPSHPRNTTLPTTRVETLSIQRSCYTSESVPELPYRCGA